jgi:hypothetical protein
MLKGEKDMKTEEEKFKKCKMKEPGEKERVKRRRKYSSIISKV